MATSRCHWLAVGFLAITLIANQVIGADHRDGPRVVDASRSLKALDLNDLYVFVSPANPNNTVLIMTTGGLDVGIISEPFFLPGATYEIRVSNDGVKTNDEVVFQFVFSDPDRFGRQSYHMRGSKVGNRGKGGGRGLDAPVLPVIARGVTGQLAVGNPGIKVTAGIFDDPFFFNLDGFVRFRTATQQGATLEGRVAAFGAEPPRNGFTKNTLAIVIEVPRVQLQSSPSNPNITLWQRCLGPDGIQFDRMGVAAINTAIGFDLPLLQKPSIQDLFNSGSPATDAALIPEAAQRINLIWGLPLTGSTPTGLNATQLAGALLPDVITFNTANPNGFVPGLNGRRLADDVIDFELTLLTGGVVTSDGVGLDSSFRNQFPYLAPAQLP